MTAGLLNPVLGSISNRVLASNLNNGRNLPDNQMVLSIECETQDQKNVTQTGCNRIETVTIGDYGLAGQSFHTQRCFNSLKTKIEQSIMRAEEKAIRYGNTLKIQYSTAFPTGTSSTASPIVNHVGKNLGLTPISMFIVPNNHCESYQLKNTINCLAVSSFQPLILVSEDYAELIPEETKIRAGIVSSGNASNFIKMAQFSFEFSCKLSKLISGQSDNKSKKTDETGNKKDDDLAFLDNDMECCRDQSLELETSISGKQNLFVLHYNRSNRESFEEMAILKPSIRPQSPGDPLVIVEYNSCKISEDDVLNMITTSLEKQDLKPEKYFTIPSDHNEIYALIPTEIPGRLKDLINYVKKDGTLHDVLEKWAKTSILSRIPPIRRGYETKILKDRLSQIFFQQKSEAEELVKKQGFSSGLEELKDTNFWAYLAFEEDVFLKPLGGEIK